MDVGSALVGALLAAPLSGLGAAVLDGVLSRRHQRHERVRSDVDRACSALEALRQSYLLRRAGVATSPDEVALSALEVTFVLAAGRVSYPAAERAARYLDAARRYARGDDGVEGEQAAFAAMAVVLFRARGTTNR